MAGFAYLVGTSGWLAYLFAARWVRTSSASLRVATALVIQYWLLTALFVALIPFYGFRIWMVVPLLGVAAYAAHRWLGANAIRLLPFDLRRAGKLWELIITSRLLWFVMVGIMILFARFVRTLLAPPLGWDALTYHLLKAGRWVQSGGLQPEQAPDAWGYYEYMPAVGDIYWSWAMLPFRGDAFVGVAGILIWFTCLVSAYSLARQLRIDRIGAAWGALLVGYTPAVMNYIASAYVDNTGVAVFLLSLTMFLHSWRTRNPVTSLLGMAALGLAAGIRVSFLPILVLTVPLVVVTLYRQVRHLGRYARYFAGCAFAATVPCFSYFYALAKTGNILYPIHVNFLGKRLFEGNEEFMVIHYGVDYAQPPKATWDHYVQFWNEFLFSAPTYEHLNLTAFAPLALGFAFVGLVVVAKKNPGALRWGALYTFVVAALNFYFLLSPATAHYREVWAETMGRFFTGGYSVMLLFSVTIWPTLYGRVLLGFLSIISLVCTVPLGMGEVDTQAVTWLLGFSVPLLLVGAVIRVKCRTGQVGRGIKGVLVVSVLIVLCGVAFTRDKLRYRFYDSVPEAYDVHRLAWNLTPSRLWEYLDRPGQPLNVAHTAGFLVQGHNWFRYPYIGRRLQNRVQYVPVTQDGSVFDNLFLDNEGINPASRGHFPSWYQRLRDLKIHYVACSGPVSFEVGWLERRKDLFERAFVDPRQLGVGYRVIENTLPPSSR